MNAWNYGRKVEAKWKPFLDNYYSENYSAWKDVENVDLQRNLDIDRIVKDKFGKIYTTEDKYIPEYCTYDQLFLEWIQNTNINSPGWMQVSRAKEILYCLCSKSRLRVFHLDLAELREWFWENKKHCAPYQDESLNTKPFGYFAKIKDLPIIKKGEIVL